MKRSPIQKILFKIEDLFIMVNDCYFRKNNPIVGFRHLRKTLLSWQPDFIESRLNHLPKTKIYDILQKQPEVAKTQIQVSGS